MRTLELRPEDLPITIRFQSAEGEKDYLLLKTKQDRLLLNKHEKPLERSQKT